MPQSPSPDQIKSFQAELLAWANAGNLREFPWRKTTQPYETLIAEILLGATLAVKVEALYKEFLRRYPDFQALADADESELAELLEPLGLQNRRASAFIRIGNELAGKGVPESEDELLDLPYVGPYAANATLCFAFGQRRAIVDTNVIRAYERAFGIDLPQESAASWEFAQSILPEEEVRTYNLALLDFGALICISENPRCQECFFSDDCVFYNQQRI